MALNENRLDVAERLLKPHLKEDPFDVARDPHAGRAGGADRALARCREPAAPRARARARLGPPREANLALVLGRMGRPAEALELLDDIFAAEPDELGHWNLKAATLGRLGDFDEAIQLYERCSRETPNQPRVWLSYGHMLKTVGRQAEGDRRLSQGDRDQADAGRSLVEPRQPEDGQFDEADVAAMEQALERRDLSDEDRFHLDFALGKAMHDAGRTDEAFAHYARGQCAAAARASRIDPANISAHRRPLHRALHREAFAERAGRLRGARPDLHRRHAARRLDAGRADPVVATAWSKARPSCPTSRRWRARPGAYPAAALEADRRRARASWARNI